MKSFGLTDKGIVRKDNQDCFIIEKCEGADCLVAVVCDGMGGAKAGSLASHLAIKSFTGFVLDELSAQRGEPRDYKAMLKRACETANSEVYAHSLTDESFRGMGTTIVGGVVRSDGKGYITNVGDSRAYHISTNANRIIQVTKDHSLVEHLVSTGVITREQARVHPRKNLITRAVGTEPYVESDYFEVSLEDGDIILLCSDGLSNIVTDEEMLKEAINKPEPELLCRALLDMALQRGAGDNVTVVAVIK